VRQDKTPNLIWFLAGVGLGAVVGVMLSPQSGADTRRMLSRRAREASGYVTTHGHDYLEYGRDLYDKGRQLADEAAHMYEEGRRLVEDASAAEAGA
jgi:gas vesicle protein